MPAGSGTRRGGRRPDARRHNALAAGDDECRRNGHTSRCPIARRSRGPATAPALLAADRTRRVGQRLAHCRAAAFGWRRTRSTTRSLEVFGDHHGPCIGLELATLDVPVRRLAAASASICVRAGISRVGQNVYHSGAIVIAPDDRTSLVRTPAQLGKAYTEVQKFSPCSINV